MLSPTQPDAAVQQYYKLQPRLKKKFAADDYVVIDSKTGDYFVGKTSVEAMKKARSTRPKGKLFLAQVGRLAGFMK